jgi:hypothetical protein
MSSMRSSALDALCTVSAHERVVVVGILCLACVSGLLLCNITVSLFYFILFFLNSDSESGKLMLELVAGDTNT